MKSKIILISLLLFTAQNVNIFAMQDDEQKQEESKKRKEISGSELGSAQPGNPGKRSKSNPESAVCQASTEQSTVASIDYLNNTCDYLIIEIFSWLDVQSLGKIAQTCKRFRLLAKDKVLLSRMLRNFLSCEVENPECLLSCRDAFKIVSKYFSEEKENAEDLSSAIQTFLSGLTDENLLKYIEKALQKGFDDSSIFQFLSTQEFLTFDKIGRLLIRYSCCNALARGSNKGCQIHCTSSIICDLIRDIAQGCCYAQNCDKLEKFKATLDVVSDRRLFSNFYETTFFPQTADVSRRTIFAYPGVNPILISASKGAKFLVYALMKKGFRILDTTNEGNNVLHIAIKNDQNDFVKWLLTLDPAIVTKILNSPNTKRLTPLQVAISRKNIQIINILLVHGAKVDFETLKAAIKSKLCGVLENLIKSLNCSIDVNFRDGKGKTLLHYAVKSGDPALINIILDNGGQKSITCIDNFGMTPIAMAEMLGFSEIKKLLEEKITKSEIALVETGSSSRCAIQ